MGLIGNRFKQLLGKYSKTLNSQNSSEDDISPESKVIPTEDMASIVFQVVSHTYTGESFVEVGWRIMFYTAIGPGLLSLLIRFKMNESEVWIEKKKLHKIERNPLLRVLTENKIDEHSS